MVEKIVNKEKMTRSTTSREVRLVSRPNGIPTAANFSLARTKLEPLKDQQVLVRKETVVEGIDKAVDAFIGLFEGKNVGKMVVKLA